MRQAAGQGIQHAKCSLHSTDQRWSVPVQLLLHVVLVVIWPVICYLWPMPAELLHCCIGLELAFVPFGRARTFTWFGCLLPYWCSICMQHRYVLNLGSPV